jgi:hypothetical protein
MNDEGYSGWFYVALVLGLIGVIGFVFVSAGVGLGLGG